MSIVNQVVNIIMKQIELPIREDGWMRERMGRSERSGQIVLRDMPIIVARIERMHPHPEVVWSEGEDLLGVYFYMSSPGRIVLYSDRLGSFFWHLALAINVKGYYMEYRDFEFMAHLVVMKTYVHEQFHHFCDVVSAHIF